MTEETKRHSFNNTMKQGNKPEIEAVVVEMFDYFKRDRQRGMRRMKMFGMFLLTIFFIGVVAAFSDKMGLDGFGEEKPILGVIKLSGTVGTKNGILATPVIETLKRAFEDESVDKVVLLINSPGGSPYTSERIINVIDNLKAEHEKPLVAIIEGSGASAAYMIAAHADRIIAGNYSTVGSIGAIMSTWDFHKLAEKVQVGQNIFASGKLKDMLNPFREALPHEKKKAQRIVDQAARFFADDVIANRGDKLKIDRDKMTTGEVWVGGEALALGIIDEIGNIDTLKEEGDYEIRDFEHEQPLFEKIAASVSVHIMSAVRDAASVYQLR